MDVLLCEPPIRDDEERQEHHCWFRAFKAHLVGASGIRLCEVGAEIPLANNDRHSHWSDDEQYGQTSARRVRCQLWNQLRMREGQVRS